MNRGFVPAWFSMKMVIANDGSYTFIALPDFPTKTSLISR
jgi:hypothetical protein